MASITTFACPLAPRSTSTGLLAIARLTAIAGKARHGGVSRLAHPFSAENFHEGEKQNPQVEPERSMIDVPYVEPKTFLPGLRVAAVDLCPAGDARAHLMPAGLLGGIKRQVFDEQGPRAHETHVPAKNVPQLRQLVEAVAAHEAARRCEPLGVGLGLADGIRRVRHRPELV